MSTLPNPDAATDERLTLPGLKSEEYEHKFDNQALKALKSTPGFEFVVRKINEYGIERLEKIQFTGSNLKAGGQVLPEVRGLLERACEILDMRECPELYVSWSYQVGAFTAGVEKPIVVLTSGAVDLLTPQELSFVIGHELGHIKSGHVLYHQMADVLPVLGNIVGAATLGVGSLVSTGLQLALLNWDRMSEFSADRAGLLACQDMTTAGTVLMKAAGVPAKYFGSVPVEGFLAQAREFEGYDFNTLDKIAKIVSTLWRGHPWTVMRASELLKWVDGGDYDAIRQRASSALARGTCPSCGRELNGEERFCPRCGARLS